MKGVDYIDLGTVDFEDALGLQERAAADIAGGAVERLHLLEHPPVFTAGRGHKDAALEVIAGVDGEAVPCYAISRGGEMTFHGPGQLVVYPHLDLKRRSRDLHRYLRDLEETLIRTAAGFQVTAFRREGLTGVWTSRGKLASIGVGVRRWVTLHGVALNVTTDLRYFDLIDPCGMADCPMTSLEHEGAPAGMAEVKAAFSEAFAEVFEEAAVS